MTRELRSNDESAFSADRPIMAVVYDDGIAADRFLADVGYKLRDRGVNVGGVVQRNTFVRNRTKCDMELEELQSGEVFQISEDRGAFAKGCRLDRSVLARISSAMEDVVAQRPAILVVNKFGKVEAEGGGLRDVIALAVQLGIPTIVGVPFRNVDQWRAFAGNFAQEVGLEAASDSVWVWLGGDVIQTGNGAASLSASL
jgi:hypothetical protein